MGVCTETRGDGVAVFKVGCVLGCCMARNWVSFVAAELLCETRFPKGFLVSRHKGNPIKETGSAMRSGTGTVSFFYVACDHGRCGALGGL